MINAAAAHAFVKFRKPRDSKKEINGSEHDVHHMFIMFIEMLVFAGQA